MRRRARPRGVLPRGVFRRVVATGAAMALVASGCVAVQLVSAAPASAAQTAATAISAGYTHACMIRSGKAYCWGNDTYGELGNNSTVSSSVPVAVYTGGVLSGLTLTQITAGNGYTCALASTGAAYCWGYNVDGELGNGATLPGAQQNTPVAVSGSLSFSQMSAGEYSMCALTTGNVGYCWGQNSSGQLGDGITTSTSTPVQEGPVNQVSIGGLFSCAISAAAGAAYCTGQGTSGQLGNGSTSNSLSPVQVTGSSSYSEVDAGFNHACALSTAGAAYCWGDDTYGEDGNSTITTPQKSPVAVYTGGVLSGLTLTQISSGGEHTCALSTASAAYCWGDDTYGELGNNTTSSVAGTYDAPVAVTTSGALSGKTLTQVSAGQTFTCALDSTGAAYCWGNNSSGQLGNGTTTSSAVPVAIVPGAPTGVTAFPAAAGTVVSWVAPSSFGIAGSASGYTATASPGGASCTTTALTCTITGLTNGTTYTITVVTNTTAGNSSASTAATVTPWPPQATIATGSASSCTIYSGKAYCWGDDTYGELGNNTTTSTPQLSPQAVYTGGVLAGVTLTQIVVGANFTCALSSAGAVYCWGLGTSGQLGNSASASSNVPVAVTATSGTPLYGVTVTEIDAGGSSVCALSSTGVAYCWGAGGSGQLGNGTTTAAQSTPVAVTATSGTPLYQVTVTQLSVGGSSACALSSTGVAYCWGAGGSGQLGNGTTTAAQSTPVAVTATSGTPLYQVTVTQLSVGGSSACALSSTGVAYCWGAGGSGQLGNGTTTAAQSTPVAVTATSGTPLYHVTVTQLSVGGSSACASSSTGVAYCWGAGGSGQLGNGTTTAAQSTPVAVTATSGTPLYQVTVTQISAGSAGACVQGATGTAYCWGANTTGQLGNDSTTQQNTAVLVGPQAPTSVTAAPGNTTAAVSWTAPVFLNYGTLTGYTATTSPGAFTCTTTSATSCTITGLTAGATYTVAVTTTATTGTSAPSTAASVIILAPGLTIVKTANVTTVVPGGTVQYTITVTNSGQTAYTGATFTDPLTGILDDAVYNANAAATVGTVSYTSPNLTWTGNLAVGATATITYSVTVSSPDTGSGILANTVTSTTAGSNCASGSPDARCTATVTVSGLTIVKTANVSTVAPGGTVAYTITVTNSGQTVYTGATFTDPLTGILDDAVYNANAAATAGTVSYTSPNLTWTGNLAVGATATITYSVTVNNPDTGSKILANTVTSTTAGSNCASGSPDARCTATVTVSGLTIVKTANVSTVAPGGTVAYTITVTNSGQTAYTGATFTDPLTGVLDDAVYNANAAVTVGTVSYTSPNLTWTGNLAVGATATITYSVTVSSPDTGSGILANTVTTTTAGSNCAAGSGNAACTATVTVSGLTIVKTANVSAVAPGGTVAYTITVTNSGQTAYTGATFTDPLTGILDDAVYNANAAATVGAVSYTSPNLTWTGNLAVGATATITYSVTVSSPDTGSKILANTVTSTTAGSNCASGSPDARCTATVTVSGLTIVKTANVSTVAPGGTVSYTVTVTNSGQTAYTGATFTDPLTSVLANAVYNANAAATAGTVSYTSPNLTWTGNLAVGATATITYSVTVNSPDTGSGIMANTVTSTTAGSNCASGSGNASCTATVTVSGLTIVKTANVSSVAPGGTVAYTITVTNSGPTAYTGATFTDPLAGVLDDAVYNANAAATAGTVSYTSPNLTWTGNLAVGAVATITYSVTVSNPDTGSGILANTVTSTTAGSNCASGSGNAACTATVTVSGLTIVKTANVSTVAPGGTVAYTVTVTNSGQTAYTGATFTDPLTSVLANAVYNANAAATAGTVSYTSPNLTWTGNLAVGATATITYSVTVNSPDTGSGIMANTVTSTTAGSNCASGSGNAACTATVTVSGLTIVKTANVSAVAPGGTVAYTVTVTNSGQTAYTGATFTDPLTSVLANAVYNANAAATAGTVSYTSPNLTWTGNLAVGATATITYSVTVSSPDTGSKILANTVTSTTAGSNCASGSGNAACTATVTVSGLTIVKTASVSSIAPGGTVAYTVTVTNSGQTAYTGATFTDPLTSVLANAVYNANASATAGTVSYTSPNLTWTGNLAVGATATITYSVTVSSPDTGSGILANTVTSTTAGSNCASGSGNASCTATVTVSGLTIVKTANVSSVAPGGTVSYTVTVTNSGQTAYTGATFTDPLTSVLANAVYNANAAATAGTVSYTSPNLTWTGNLAVGATATITYSVTVNSPDTGSGIMANTVTSTTAGSNCASGSGNAACTATVTVSGLTIVKTASVSTVAPGGTVAYTVTVTNSGQTAYTGATFTDPLTSVLANAVYNANASATAGTVSYTSPNLTWTGNLAVGAVATITYSVTVSSPDTGSGIMANTVTSTTAGSNCASGSGNAACTATVTVSGLTIVKTANVSTIAPGGTVAYTITVTNSGPTPYTGATFTDPLSSVLANAVYNANATATAGTVSYTSPNLSWTGNLAVGATATITYSVTVSSPDTGSKILLNTVTSTTAGSNCASGSGNAACTATVTVSGLTIVKTASVSSIAPGGTVTYTIAVTNSGQTAYTGATFTDPLTSVLANAVYNANAAATAGTVSYTSPNLTWTGNLAVGAVATITYSVTVNSPDTGSGILANTVTSTTAGSNCAAGSGNAACTATVTVSGLTIVKTANVSTVAPGGTVSYTVTVTNSGQTAYTGATFTDPLTSVLANAVYNANASATAGTVSYTSPNLTWTGNLAVGATATITYSVTVSNPDTGSGIMANTVTSTTAGSNCASGSGNVACTATVTVSGLTIVKTANVSTIAPGGTVSYTVTVTNSGPTAYTGATFTDPLTSVLANAVYNANAAANAGTVSYTSPNLTWTGNLAVGAVATITYSVTVNNPDTGSGILANTVTSTTAGSNCASGSGNAACTATVTVSGLTIVKTANVSTIAPGGTVQYTVTVTNSGQTAYTGATFTDPLTSVLANAVYNANAAATAGAVSYTSPNLTWTGNLAVGGTATITYTVTVNSPDTGSKIMANTVTSTTAGSNCASGSGNASCTATVTVSGLTIVKTASVSTVAPGGTVAYTVTVTNSGQTAYTGATFTDPLTSVLANAVYNANASATAGAVSYTSPNLTWTGNLAVGATATITYSVTVSSPDTGSGILANTVTSTTTGSNCASGSGNASCTATVTVSGLTIVKTANVSSVAPGGTVAYTITVTNSGPTPYTGATFTDPLTSVLANAVYNANAAATAGTVSYASPNLTWTGNLAAGASATVTYSVTVSSPDTGSGIMANTVTSTTAGSNCASGSGNPSCTATVTVSGLTIVKTASVSAVAPGGTVSYTVTVTNSGQTAYTGATFTDPLTSVLANAVYNANATATAGTVSYTSPNLTWTGNLAVGATATITYSVTVNNPDTGSGIMANTVTSTTAGSNCASGSGNAACTATVTVSGLTIVKTANVSAVAPGGTVSYTVTVTNSGQTAYTGATFTDPLTSVLANAVYNANAAATAGAVSYASPNLTWTGNLAVGATATITYSVTVSSPDTGSKILSNTVTSPTAGSNCAAGSGNAACTATVTVSGLTIVKTASVSTVAPGGTVAYTVTVTNSGQTAYTGATFTDPLTSVLANAVYNANAAATAGTVSYTSPNLTWTGNLAVGATATITYSVTVNNPDTGSGIMANTVTSTTAGSNCASGSGNAACTATVTVSGLTIVKTANVSTVAPGGTVAYTITVTNSGQTPYTGATFTDPLTSVLANAVYNANAAATAGTVSYASPNLTWTGNLAVGAVATITYSVTVSSPDTGSGIMANTITSTTAGSNCAAGSGNAACTATVTVSGLTTVKTANVSTVAPGGTVAYTVTVTNSGQTAYTGATFTDPLTSVLANAVYNANASATAGAVSYTSPNLTWTGNLAVGATATITYSVTVNSPDTGTKIMTNTVTSTTAGSNCAAGSGNAACTATVTVSGLTIVKTANVSTVAPGGTVSYTVTVTNSGQTAYTGATFTDPLTSVLANAVYNANAAATVGAVSYASPNLTWTGNLAVGAVATITYSVTVNNPDTGSGILANTVTSTTAGSNCASGSGNAACTVTVTVSGLTIVKTANVSSIAPGGTVAYTVTVTNSGQTAYTGATFTDPLTSVLANAVYNANAAATVGAVSYASPNLTWTGNLAVGATATITYTVTVNSPDTGSGILANTVTSTTAGSNCASGSGNAACTATVTVSGLTIVKTANVSTVAPGGTVAYTVTVTNSGQTAYTGATFTDPLTSVLANAVYNANAAATAGAVSYASPNLTWTGNLAAGASATVTYSVTVSSPDTGSGVLANTVTSTTAGSNCAAGSGNAACTATVTVSGLTIVKTANVGTITPGGAVSYTITVTNSGQAPYTGATFTDQLTSVLANAVYNGNATATVGAVSYASPNLTWTGNLAVGASATITYSVTVDSPDTGSKIMTNTVTSTTAGSNCASGSADARCTTSVTVLVPALTITKTASATAVVPGQPVGYTITVTDSGQTPYAGATVTDSLAGVLGDAAYNGDAAATAGAVSYAGPVLTWTGNLAAGGTATITYSVTVNNPDTDGKVMTNTVVSAAVGSTCPAGGGNAACTATVAVLTPGLTIVKTANVATATPGGTVGYTITVTDSGQTPYTGATFTDPLAGVLANAAYNADAAATTGTVSYTSPVLTWTGNLAVGASATITYSVTVNSPDTDGGILVNTVTSTTAGSNCGSGSTDTRCTATVAVSQLLIVNQSNVTTTMPGGVVRFTATFTNSGQVPYTGITIATDASHVLDYATVDGDQTATSGTLTITGTGVSWTGNIPVAGTVTVTGTVTVDNPVPVNTVLTSTITTSAPGSNCPLGGTDPRCSVSVTVLTPGLTITKTANATAVVPGQPVSYTITVTDSGQTPYTGATVTDSLAGVLGDAAYNGDATATAGTVSYAGPVLTWTGTLAAGGTATITYSVTVDNPDTDGKVMTNTVVSAAVGSTCPAGGGNAACTATVRVLTPGLTIVKTASLATATPGATVGYTITVTDSGQTPYTSATFTDPLAGVLGDAAYNADAAATAGTVSYASPVLTWTGNLAVGASATITYSVTVDSPDTGGGILANTVTSTTAGSNCASGSTDARCTVTVAVAQLLVVVQANVATTTPGGVVRFTSTLTNTGQVPYHGITMLPAGSASFAYITADGDQTATSGTLTVTATGASWTGDIPVGGTVVLTGSVTVDSSVPLSTVLTITDTTTGAAGSNCPAGSADPRCTASVTVLTPGLTITKTASATAVVPGQPVSYTITVTDSGQTPYTGATVTDSLAGVLGDAAYNGDATATAGTVSYAGPVLSWTGNLAAGGTATITYSVTVDNPDTDGKVMTNTVVSAAVGSTCPAGGGNAACTATVRVLTPGLTIVKTANVATATPGATVGYTITVTDSGQTPYTGATFTDPLAGVLGDAAYNGDAAATAGTVSYASPNLTWTGNLAVGATATITYAVTVDSPDTGGGILANTVTSTTPGSNCGPGSTDTECTATVAVAQLLIVSQADVSTTTPGGVIRFTSTFTNTGQVFYDGITIVPNLSASFAYITADGDQSATSGTLTLTGAGVSWSGDIPAGGTVTVTGTVTVDNPVPANTVLTIIDSTSATGSNCPSGSNDPRCSVSVTVLTPGLTITKTASATAVVPGQPVGYTITVADTGQTPYAGATVTDSLAGVLGDAAYDGDAAASTGAVSYAGPVLTWTGNLAAGGTATITYSVTVNNPDTDGKVMTNTVVSAAVGSTCPAGGGNAACTATVTVLTPGLTITKTANAATATPGATVGYTITVTDSGQTPYTGATITDDLTGVVDDAAYDNDASTTAGTVSYASPVLTWTGNLAVGATATITYSVTADNPDTGDIALANTVTSAAVGSNCASGSTDPRCTVTIGLVGTKTLTFTNTANVASTTAGGVVDYTITAANSGLTAYSGATFTDDLTGVLANAAYNGDASATVGTVTYTSPGLTWSGTVPAGGIVSITYSVTVNSPDTGNMILANTVSSTSPDSDCGSGSTDARCTATVAVAQLLIVVQSNVATTTPGGVIRFTSTFTNTGQVPYNGITIVPNARAVLAYATPDGNQSATSGTLTVTPTSVSWTGDIPVGGTVVISGTVTLHNSVPLNTVLTATDSTSAPGSNCPAGSTDSRCSVSVTVLTPALTITKTASATTVVPGQPVSYTITVADSGQTPYAGATVTDSLAGVLGDAAYDGDAAATAGTVSYAGPVLTWTGNLAVGATATITYSVTVNNPDTGGKVMTNTVVSAAIGSTCPAGGGNAACTATVAVLTPVLDILKTANVATATPGGTVGYTITVTDSGQTPYTGATVTDPLTGVLGDAAYDGDAAATAGTVSYASPVLTWTGNLAVGATATITYSVTVDSPDTGGGILTNTVTSTTAGSNCGPGSTDTDCTATVAVAQLLIVVQSNVATTTPGGVIRFTSTFTNTGQVPYNGITIVPNARAVLAYATPDGNQSATSGTLTVTPTSVSWTGDIPVGGTVVISGTVTLHNSVPLNTVLTATDSTSAPGSNCPSGGSTDPRCSVSVTVLTPGLTITKTANATAVVPGQPVGYTITVADTGQTPYTGATVTDSLAGVLGDAAYNGDAAASTGAVSYAGSVLTWTGTLAAGGTATITYSVTVNNPDTDGKVMTNTVVSAAVGSTCPAGGGNAACTATVAVLTPGLTIVKTASLATATPGATVGYTITVTDSGQTPYTGATFTDPLAGVLGDAAYNADAAATAGSVSYASPVLTWTGNLAVGASATITYSVTVDSPDTGGGILVNTVTSATAGSNCASGSTDARCTATVTVAQLLIVYQASEATTTPGAVIRVTATYTNTGQVPYSGIAIVTGASNLLVYATGDGDRTATSGTLTITGASLSWTGDIPVGGTVTVTGTVTVHNSVPRNTVLTSTTSTSAPGSNCPSGGTDPRCSVSVTVLTPGLTITKTASATAVVPGQPVSYTITVADTGQTPYAGATVTDSLAGVVGDAAYNGDAAASTGAVSYAGSVLTWTGTLAAGGTATITYSVTVNNPDTGGKVMTNTVVSAAVGSTCPAGGGNAACTATVAVLTPGLTIVKTASLATATPGAAVGYTITVTDSGQTPYTGATFTDPLTGVLADAAYNADAAATAGAVAYTSPVLTWTGNLAVGGTATITYSVTVNNPDTGGGTLANTVTSTTAGSNCASGSTDARCSVTVAVAQLLIVSQANEATTTPGAVIRFTSTFTNTGQVPYDGITIVPTGSDSFAYATLDGDQTATSGTLIITATGAYWTGDIPVGGTVVITGTFTVDNPVPVNTVFTITDSTTAPGSNCPSGGTDPGCTATVTVLTPGLTITKTANISTTTPGATVGYTITVSDTGQTPYAGASVTDDLTGVLNDASYNGDGTATTGTVSYASPALTWTGNLAVGATATITYSATVQNPDTGDKLLVNTVTSDAVGSNCPVSGTAAACTASVQDLIPALTITKTADNGAASPGGTVHYTITVADTGQTPYTDATVTDDLTGVLDDASYNADAAATAGSMSYASPDLTWTGDLDIGGSVTITYSATVDDPETGDKIMANIVTSAAPGSNCPSGTTNPACSATVAVITGMLSISVPAGADLGAIAVGATATGSLGTVTVTDNRALPGASWTATVSSTDFINTVTPADLIQAGDVSYLINALGTTTGSAIFTPTPVTVLSGSPQAVVTATSANGDNSAAWDPQIQVSVPSTTVIGTYTATITHSAS